LGDSPLAVLVGPEGGFSQGEIVFLRGLPFVIPVSLGPGILRAETALIAALSCVRVLREVV
jgi:16S rRNA (uracil1498-N3)-methyltransferase